jgi:hypothetical protein
MKKILFLALVLAASALSSHALEPQKNSVFVATGQTDENVAEIKFDTLTHDFGTFSESDPVVSCEFKFTNVGTAPLVIHQAISSCGCTVPDYTKSPIKPGEHGSIKVTYNGKGKHPGRFRKVITVRSNAKENKAVNLYIQGEMTPVEEKQN